MRTRNLFAHAALITVFAASQVQAQRVIDLTSDLLDRFLKGADAEQVELGKSGDQLKEIDEKLKAFRECKKNFELATGSGGKLGMAARIALRAKCGASDEDGIMKERNKITEGPTNAAAKTAGMKTGDYVSLKEKITAYMHGDRMGFSQPGLDLLKSREADLSKAMGMPVVQPVTLSSIVGGGSSGGGMRGSRMSGAWTSDYAWTYIGHLFSLQYASGAAMFEEDYKPGEWTKWSMTDGGNKDESQTVERAFLALQPDSSEWWRTKTISTWKEDNKEMADTVIMEALYKPTSEWTKELVRVRAKLPGNKDAQELLVPQGMGMINYNAAIFGTRPTKESIEGATVGEEKITTKAGPFTAKHIRFAAGNGTLDWWVTKEAPGGWVKFTGPSNYGDEKAVYTMELVAKGTGAKSELGVIK
jgi:hypothetical protein